MTSRIERSNQTSGLASSIVIRILSDINNFVRTIVLADSSAVSAGVNPICEVARGKTMSSIVGMGGMEGGVGSRVEDMEGRREGFKESGRRRGKEDLESGWGERGERRGS